MQAAAQAGQGSDALRAALEGAPLRHVVIEVERSSMEQSVPPAVAGLTPGILHERRIPLADGTLVIRADARAEIREVLQGGGRVMATLLLLSLILAGLAWLVHRALAPVRELERGLAHLGGGEGSASAAF